MPLRQLQNLYLSMRAKMISKTKGFLGDKNFRGIIPNQEA